MGELYSLKWKNHCNTFLGVLRLIRIQQMYSDVTLACEGKFYNAHKMVLSACSDYFQDIFIQTDCKNPVIVLKDINPDHFEALLDYMYIGEVNVTTDELPAIIKAAECLKIKGLATFEEEPVNIIGSSNSKCSHSTDFAVKRKLSNLSCESSPSPKFAKYTETTPVCETDSETKSDIGPSIIKEEIIEHMNIGAICIEDVRCMDQNNSKQPASSFHPQQGTRLKSGGLQTADDFYIPPSNDLQSAVPGSQRKYESETWHDYRMENIKSRKCPYCVKEYAYTSLLRNHIRVHTGEKPFACDYCPYRSNQKGNLKTHLIAIHKFS